MWSKFRPPSLSCPCARNATRSSIPGVLRPLLICVACLTLNSAFARLCNIKRCRDLSFLLSPHCEALKICCRIPFTASKVLTQSMSCHRRNLRWPLDSLTARSPFLIRGLRLAFLGDSPSTRQPAFTVGIYPIQQVMCSLCLSAGWHSLLVESCAR